MRILVLVLAVLAVVPATASESPDNRERPGRGDLGFIQNLGQFAPEIRFVVRSRGLIAQLTADAVHWNLFSAPDVVSRRPGIEGDGNPEREREVTALRSA